MIDFFTSDSAILILSGFGLVATAFTIVSDARAQQRARVSRADIRALPSAGTEISAIEPREIAA